MNKIFVLITLTPGHPAHHHVPTAAPHSRGPDSTAVASAAPEAGRQQVSLAVQHSLYYTQDSVPNQAYWQVICLTEIGHNTNSQI